MDKTTKNADETSTTPGQSSPWNGGTFGWTRTFQLFVSECMKRVANVETYVFKGSRLDSNDTKRSDSENNGQKTDLSLVDKLTDEELDEIIPPSGILLFEEDDEMTNDIAKSIARSYVETIVDSDLERQLEYHKKALEEIPEHDTWAKLCQLYTIDTLEDRLGREHEE